jgi:hypothetical protein
LVSSERSKDCDHTKRSDLYLFLEKGWSIPVNFRKITYLIFHVLIKINKLN